MSFGAIFISYRRLDSEGQAGRLFDGLVERFGADSVFMDVEKIRPGDDFRHAIESSVSSCNVLLALIGPAWLDSFRVDDPQDYLRLEIASALRRGIPVIPVLLRETGMPRADQLPQDLAELAYRQAVALRHQSWDTDVQELIAVLQSTAKPAAHGAVSSPPRPTGAQPAAGLFSQRVGVLALGTVSCIAVLALLMLARRPGPQAEPHPSAPNRSLLRPGTPAISLHYYAKASDPASLNAALLDLGFQMATLPSHFRMAQMPTNAIWFGSRVPLPAIEQVAATLINAGVPIKASRCFAGNPPEPKASRILVGADADLQDRPALDLATIRRISHCPN